MGRDKVPLTIMLSIDTVFILAMFLGLLRLRGRGGDMFGLVRVLWKQVRWWKLLVAAVLSLAIP